MTLRTTFPVCALLLGISAPAAGQIRASEEASLSQTVDGTTITLDYSRPRLRGRSPIFGGIVHWGEVWTPGANWATTLETSHDITLDGHQVPAGKYSMWMVVNQDGWTMVLDPDARRYHTDPPKERPEQIRYPLTVESAPETEVLTWSVPVIRSDGMTLVMRWADRRVPLEVRVPESRPSTVAAAAAEPYVGRYELRSAQDTTRMSPFRVYHADGRLQVDWDRPPFPELKHLWLIHVDETWFYPATVVNGELFDVMNDIVLEFDVTGGKATGFVFRDQDDTVLGRGARMR